MWCRLNEGCYTVPHKLLTNKNKLVDQPLAGLQGDDFYYVDQPYKLLTSISDALSDGC